MSKPTYLEQYNKVVTAYMKDELDPMNACACFIGNILEGNRDWEVCRMSWNGVGNFEVDEAMSSYENHKFDQVVKGRYTPTEIVYIENAFLTPQKFWNSWEGNASTLEYQRTHPDAEAQIYEGMVAGLEKLKEVHESWGEVVDGKVELVKRELNAV